MTVQISLFDELPGDVDIPESGKPAVVFSEGNRENGHLLITTGPPRARQDWLFLNEGRATIRCCLPGWDSGVDLNAEQLRVLGGYCFEMADRLERRGVNA